MKKGCGVAWMRGHAALAAHFATTLPRNLRGVVVFYNRALFPVRQCLRSASACVGRTRARHSMQCCGLLGQLLRIRKDLDRLCNLIVALQAVWIRRVEAVFRGDDLRF